jgi:hypothetical protein
MFCFVHSTISLFKHYRRQEKDTFKLQKIKQYGVGSSISQDIETKPASFKRLKA